MPKLILNDSFQEYLSVSQYINWKDTLILQKAEDFHKRASDALHLYQSCLPDTL